MGLERGEGVGEPEEVRIVKPHRIGGVQMAANCKAGSGRIARATGCGQSREDLVASAAPRRG